MQAVLTMFAVSVMVFGFMSATGDASAILLPPEATDQDIADLRHKLGLDQPLPIQYLKFITNVWYGDTIRSFQFNTPVLPLVMHHLYFSLMLVAAAMTVSILVSVPLGALAAYRRNSVIDVGVRIVAVLGQSMPVFWVALLLILLFAVRLQILPVAGVGLANMILPTLSLSFFQVAVMTRLTRSELLEVLSQDYIRTARAKGLNESVVLGRHALKNAGIPIVTIMGLQLAGLMGGAVVTETIFAWPGIGWLLFESISARDFPVVVAGVLIAAMGVTLINLAIDIAYGYLDPRVRVS
jgi:ABC-type dipeptide/oligopeptide/nickel transport system permease component